MTNCAAILEVECPYCKKQIFATHYIAHIFEYHKSNYYACSARLYDLATIHNFAPVKMPKDLLSCMTKFCQHYAMLSLCGKRICKAYYCAVELAKHESSLSLAAFTCLWKTVDALEGLIGFYIGRVLYDHYFNNVILPSGELSKKKHAFLVLFLPAELQNRYCHHYLTSDDYMKQLVHRIMELLICLDG